MTAGANHLSFPHLENVLISPFIPIGYFCLDIGFWVFISFLYHLKNTVPLHPDLHDLWGEICCHSIYFFSFIDEVLFSSGCLFFFFFFFVFSFQKVNNNVSACGFLWLYSIWLVQLPESLGLPLAQFWMFAAIVSFEFFFSSELFLSLVLGLW